MGECDRNCNNSIDTYVQGLVSVSAQTGCTIFGVANCLLKGDFSVLTIGKIKEDKKAIGFSTITLNDQESTNHENKRKSNPIKIPK